MFDLSLSATILLICAKITRRNERFKQAKRKQETSDNMDTLSALVQSRSENNIDKSKIYPCKQANYTHRYCKQGNMPSMMMIEMRGDREVW